MAIKHTFNVQDNFGHDVVLSDTYCRVSRVVGGKDLMHVNVEVLNGDKDRLFMEKSYSFTPSVEDGSDNFIKQAYEHLKTLEEFDGAEDC